LIESRSSAPAALAWAAGSGNQRSSQIVSAIRRPLLEIDGLDAAAAQDRGGVVPRAAFPVGVADDHGDFRGVGRQRQERLPALVAEVVAQEQVLRRIAGQRHFGGDHEFGAGGARLVDRGADAGRVGGEVAHGGVDLGDGDLHGTEALRECRRARRADG
jgi:hypothetical protein